MHTDDTNKIVNIVLPLLEAHYTNSYEHYVAIPNLIKELKESKEFTSHTLQQPIRNMLVGFMTSDKVGLAGYLRSNTGGNYRVVVQRRSSGHVNILTKQDPKIDLARLMAAIRLRELQLQNQDPDDEESLQVVAIHPDVPMWYYDTATNSLLNGGVTPDAVTATNIDWQELQAIILHFLTECEVESKKFDRK